MDKEIIIEAAVLLSRYCDIITEDSLYGDANDLLHVRDITEKLYSMVIDKI